MRRAKAKGRRGSWFAVVDGEHLPCVHQHWFTGLEYDDPYYDRTKDHWLTFVAGIYSAGRVIMTEDHLTEVGAERLPAFRRKRYIAVYEVTDVRTEDTHLRFKRNGQRLIELD